MKPKPIIRARAGFEANEREWLLCPVCKDTKFDPGVPSKRRKTCSSKCGTLYAAQRRESEKQTN